MNPDENVETKVMEVMEALKKRSEEIDERVKQIKIIHEDAVFFHRFDKLETLTFLDLSAKDSMYRRRTSWYGRVVTISEIDNGDAVRENKKKVLLKDDVIIFNPEAAYSLNIADFEEIWMIHIDSILGVDTGYEYMKAMEANAKSKAEIEYANQRQMMSKLNAIAKAKVLQNNIIKEEMQKTKRIQGS